MFNGEAVNTARRERHINNKYGGGDQGEAGRIGTKMRTERKNKRKEGMKFKEMFLVYLRILRQLPEDWCFLAVLFHNHI
jgi:hypothetical protein